MAKTTSPDTDAPVEALSAEDFLTGGEPKSVIVRLPEYGNKAVRVRAMTGGEQDRFAKMTTTRVGIDTREATFEQDEQVRAIVLSWCVLDVHTSQPLFSKKDVFRLASRDGAIIGRLFAIVQALSNVEQKEVDEIVAAFKAAPGDDSSIT